jgi:hypothetical protein
VVTGHSSRSDHTWPASFSEPVTPEAESEQLLTIGIRDNIRRR